MVEKSLNREGSTDSRIEIVSYLVWKVWSNILDPDGPQHRTMEPIDSEYDELVEGRTKVKSMETPLRLQHEFEREKRIFFYSRKDNKANWAEMVLRDAGL